jgi:hypothetical protein
VQEFAPDTADVGALVAYVDGAASKQLDEYNLVAAEKDGLELEFPCK